jgi:hypothetical protein
MKTIDRTKAVVLSIGVLTVVGSLVGAITSLSLMSYVFPLYVGLTLVGVSVLHKEQETTFENKTGVIG